MSLFKPFHLFVAFETVYLGIIVVSLAINGFFNPAISEVIFTYGDWKEHIHFYLSVLNVSALGIYWILTLLTLFAFKKTYGSVRTIVLLVLAIQAIRTVLILILIPSSIGVWYYKMMNYLWCKTFLYSIRV